MRWSGFGRKAVLYATCYGNYHEPQIGEATRAVLAHNGVETEVVYPGCCGMPKLEFLEANTASARAFAPMPGMEMDELRSRLAGKQAVLERFFENHFDHGRA